MYAIKNTVQLVGCVINKPVIRTSRDGKKSARFSIIVEDSYYNARGFKINETQSHTVVAQGRLANVAERHLDKDVMIAVLGRLINRCFRDNRGISRSVTEIFVNELLVLDMQVQEQGEPYNR